MKRVRVLRVRGRDACRDVVLFIPADIDFYSSKFSLLSGSLAVSPKGQYDVYIYIQVQYCTPGVHDCNSPTVTVEFII